MITRFSQVCLTRRNGKQRWLIYKTERPLTNDLFATICTKLKIPSPEWNALHNEFEFIDDYWLGSENMTPISLEFLDSDGFPIEGFEEDANY